jgi:hypothetical protein
MKKKMTNLVMSVLLMLFGCNTTQCPTYSNIHYCKIVVTKKHYKRYHRHNRFAEVFDKADSAFNAEYGLKLNE